jgi:hypothetical protein
MLWSLLSLPIFYESFRKAAREMATSRTRLLPNAAASLAIGRQIEIHGMRAVAVIATAFRVVPREGCARAATSAVGR